MLLDEHAHGPGTVGATEEVGPTALTYKGSPYI